MKAIFAILLLTPLLHGQTPGALETFTEQDNGESWGLYDYADGETYNASWDLFESNNPEVFATFIQGFGVSLFADDLASEAAFVGDYAAAGIDVVACDAYVEDFESFDVLEFYFVSDGIFYYSDYIGVPGAGWTFISNSFSKDQWFLYDTSEDIFIEVELTETILSQVTEIGVNFFPLSEDADGMAVALDNFTILPDLTPPTLTVTPSTEEVSISFERAAGISYNLETSTSLETNGWTGIDGDTSEITGDDEYEITTSAQTKAFFRVTTTPIFVEVP